MKGEWLGPALASAEEELSRQENCERLNQVMRLSTTTATTQSHFPLHKSRIQQTKLCPVFCVSITLLHHHYILSLPLADLVAAADWKCR